MRNALEDARVGLPAWCLIKKHTHPREAKESGTSG
jgi:hypothetical protein